MCLYVTVYGLVNSGKPANRRFLVAAPRIQSDECATTRG
jgi:hypothetical protein